MTFTYIGRIFIWFTCNNNTIFSTSLIIMIFLLKKTLLITSKPIFCLGSCTLQRYVWNGDQALPGLLTRALEEDNS